MMSEEGICDVSTPELRLSLSGHQMLGLLEEQEGNCDGLEEEEYFASLFARCDDDGSGLVKVSKLLDLLRSFKSLEVENDLDKSIASIASSSEELDVLKGILDPFGIDPAIDMGCFRSAISEYIAGSNSARKGEMECPLSSSPRKGEQDKLLLNFDLSGIGNDEEVFVASDSINLSREEQRDYVAEISDLRMEVNKLKDDKAVLKTRLEEAQGEMNNCQIMLTAKQEEKEHTRLSLNANTVKMHRMEAELQEKHETIASLEDKIKVITNANKRLESQIAYHEKHKQELFDSNEESQKEIVRINKLLNTAKEPDRGEEKKWRRIENENKMLESTIIEMQIKIETLEYEKCELGRTVVELRQTLEENIARSSHPAVSQELSFDMDVNADNFENIQNELLLAGNLSGPVLTEAFCEKFDRGSQTEMDLPQQISLQKLLSLAKEVSATFISLVGKEESCVRDSCPLNPEVAPTAPRSNGTNGNCSSPPVDNQATTNIVQEIQEELINFREQLKKSHELLHILRYESSNSLIHTKSCPGLTVEENLNESHLGRTSIGIQTDPPLIETPVLAQKLNLSSPMGDSLESQNSMDKLSDDGSVRVRDDLSVVFEDQEAEGTLNDFLDMDSRASSQSGRRRLIRMANTADEEDQRSPPQEDFETLTPLDGGITPVNDERYTSASENYASANEESVGGRIPESQMGQMMQLAYDPSLRSSERAGSLLTRPEWKELRKDVDKHDLENYKKAFQLEEGNEETGVSAGANVPHSEYAFSGDELAEEDLQLFPQLAENFFKVFDTLKGNDESLSAEQRKDLEVRFNRMAEVFQTEHCNLDQRIGSMTKELNHNLDSLKNVSYSLKTCSEDLKSISQDTSCPAPSDLNLIGIVNSLKNIEEELDLFASTISGRAKRLGILDCQNRLRRMMEVLLLYTHILKTKNEKLSSENTSIKSDLDQLKKVLEERNIPFSTRFLNSSPSLQVNNNVDAPRQLWDPEEREYEGSAHEGESEHSGQYIHLLEPTKPKDAELKLPKQRNSPNKQEPAQTAVKKFVSDGLEIVRRELFWPWTTEETMKGLKQGLAVFLMLLGIMVFLRGVIPSVSATGCNSPESFWDGVKRYVNGASRMEHLI